MAQDTKVAEKPCSIPTFERNRYFFGKPMTVHDFDAEQQYSIAKSRLLNRLIHGTGILCGMQLSKLTIADGKFTVEISEGAALDCCGNLIVSNRRETVEVRGVPVDGANYLYVKFAECVRQPIMASANVSSCEEVCCYNRIRETFEVFVSGLPAASPTFTGNVKRSDGQGIVGAKVEALQKEIVQYETLTNNNGNFTLQIAASGAASLFDVRASATGFGASTKTNQTASATPLSDFLLLPQTGIAPASVCREATRKYFEDRLRVCPNCDDPRVFLAVINVTEEAVTINQTETDRVRSVLYSNPMLHDLLCDHLADFNNPHRTTADQVAALQSVNGSGNGPNKPYSANIDLVPDSTITITAHSKTIDVKLANDAVRPVHLNNDTINNLLVSDGTITVQSNTAGKNIAIKTNPATSATSVGAATVAGVSKKFSPEDHVHDLANDVVTKDKLAGSVISTLVASDGTITVAADPAAKVIRIKTNPAASVSSVAGTKVFGTSPRYSPDDHAHDLANDTVTKDKLAPTVINTLVVAADDTITVTPDLAARQIRIKANPAKTSDSFRVTTGVVAFNNVEAGDLVHSDQISHNLDATTFAIVLGLESTRQTEGGAAAATIEIGDLFVIQAQRPLLAATYVAGAETFVVHLRDTRRSQNASTPPSTYFVRWWAIPSTSESNIKPELLDATLKRIRSLPGNTMEELVKDLKVKADQLQLVLDRLMADGLVREEGGKFFPI